MRDADFRGAATFQVRARRLGISARRHVDVSVERTGREGIIDIRLDRPLRAGLGIESVVFAVQVLDAAGDEVGVVSGTLRDGDEALVLPFRLPRSGPHALRLTEAGIVAGRARVRILPEGSVSMDLEDGTPDVAAAAPERPAPREAALALSSR